MEPLGSTTVEEEANIPTACIPKKKPKKLGGIVKLIGSAKNRYRALRQLKVPSAEAVDLSKKTFVELKEMGYKFGSLPCIPGKKLIKPIRKRAKEVYGQRRRYDALKKIGVTKNLQELSKKTFAELKQMGFKFSAQMPEKTPVKKCVMKIKGNTSQIPVNDIPTQHLPNEAHNENLPSRPPQQQQREDQRSNQTPVRVGIRDAKPMTDSQLKTLSYTILKKITGMPQGTGPRFNGYCRKPGWLVITCEDQRSKDWLEELIPSLKPWPEAKLEAIPESDLPKPNIAVVFIPNIDITMIEQSLSLIRAQNAIDTELWKVVNSKAQDNGVVLTLSLDSISVENLKKMDLKASLGFSKVQFRLKGLKAHQSGTGVIALNQLPQDQNLPASSSNPNEAPAQKVQGSSRQASPRMIPPLHTTAPSETSQIPLRGYRDMESPSRTDNCVTGYREVHQQYSNTDSYRGRENVNRGFNSRYSGRDDISGNILEGSSYNGRENIRENDGSSNRMGGEDFERDVHRSYDYRARDDYKERASYSGEEDISVNCVGGTSYTSRQDINSSDSYSCRETFRGDIDVNSSFSGRKYLSPSICIKDCRSVNYLIRENVNEDSTSSCGREYVQKGASYSGRQDLRRDMHGSNGDSSNRYREVIKGDIFSGIRNNHTGNTRSNEIQHRYSINNNDGSVFREGYIRDNIPQIPSCSGNFMEEDRGFKEGLNRFWGRGEGEVCQHFPPRTGSHRNIVEGIRDFNVNTSGFRGRNNSQIEQQFIQRTDDYRDNNLGENIGEINVRTNFGVREDSQNRENSSNWGNTGINTQGRGYSRGSQAYTAGVMHAREGIQSYTKGINRGDSGRYASGDDQAYVKGGNHYTKRYC